MLKINNLKKSFGKNLIFENVSLQVKSGEIVTFQGKSGEGKTTLIRCISALETVDYGDISVDDVYLCKTTDGKIEYKTKNELNQYLRLVGMVFQNFNLFPHMSVLENLIEAPKYHNIMKEDEILKKADKLLIELDLIDKKHFYPYQLSGGQSQRVAVARACMLSPKILCFDEPTSALDEENRDSIENIIKNLAKSGMGIIIITHDKTFAENISNRILHLENKNIREVIIK